MRSRSQPKKRYRCLPCVSTPPGILASGVSDASLWGTVDGVSTIGVFWSDGGADGALVIGADIGVGFGVMPSSLKSTSPFACDICVTLPVSAESVQNVVIWSKSIQRVVSGSKYVLDRYSRRRRWCQESHMHLPHMTSCRSSLAKGSCCRPMTLLGSTLSSQVCWSFVCDRTRVRWNWLESSPSTCLSCWTWSKSRTLRLPRPSEGRMCTLKIGLSNFLDLGIFLVSYLLWKKTGYYQARSKVRYICY